MPDPRRSPRGVDEAIARLSAQLRAPGAAPQPDKKFRFDFRTPRGKPANEALDDDYSTEESGVSLPALDAAVAGIEALQSAIDRRWTSNAALPAAPPAPAPANETADAQLEAIRQRLAELSGGRAAQEITEDPPRLPSALPQPAEPPESRRGFGISVLENHLARLAGEVAMLGQRRAPADPELLSRIGELRELVTAGNAGAEIDRLEQQIAAVIERVEAMSAAMLRAESLTDIARRLDAASARLDEIAEGQNRPVPAIDNLTREISLLRREVMTALRRPADSAIEAQISALAGRLEVIGQNLGGPSLAKLEAQVAAMAARLDHATITQMQEKAQAQPPAPAAPPVERRPERPPAPQAPVPTPAVSATAGAENLLILALKEDLLRLQQGRAANATSAPAQPTPRMPARPPERPLPPDEAAWQARAQEAAYPRREPEPAVEDHRPLEPGSGRPVYRTSASKSEFVAAARRAAVAAAAESEIAQPAPRQRAAAPPPGAAGAGIAGIFRGRRGAAMVAAGIVVLLLSGLPIFLNRGDSDRPMMSREAAIAPAEEPVVAMDDLPVAKTEAKLAPAPAMPGIAPPPVIGIDPSASAENHFTVLDPPATKDASRPQMVSPDYTATTRAATAPAPDLFRGAPPSQPAPNPPEAIGPERLRVAATSGDPNALFEIGARYAEGRGVTADPAEAAKWYTLAAERGLAIAQFRVASLYERGEGVTQNRSAAADWYQRAAEQGNVRSMHNLAVMLSEGVGSAPDFGLAARWFIKAADHGVRDSQYNLGVMFARGLGGQQDLVQSYKWFAVAAQQGDPDATARRDEVAKVLSPDQLAQAQAAVRAWRAIEPPANANVAPIADDSWNTTPGSVSAVDRQALVRLIQEKLSERGLDPGPADGNPGPKTRDAVIAFQRKQGLAETGEIGPELLAALSLPTR